MASEAVWPALAYEKRLWTPTATYYPVQGRASRPAHYRSAVPPLIAKQRVSLGEQAASAAELATQELSRLDVELGSSLVNFAPILLRSEAASSSQIEQLTASARSIFSAEVGIKTGPNAQLIVSNARVLQTSVEFADPLSVPQLADMHGTLMSHQTIHPSGEFREEAVWIGTRSDTPVGAEFVAPHYTLIRSLLNDLVKFAQRTDVPPLVSTAISHAQFETIHPFTDGNGRVGRAMAQAMLKQRGILRNVFVPVSAGLLADVDGYHSALTAYRQGNPDRIVQVFADASIRAVANTRQLKGELDELREVWNSQLRIRRDSHAWRLLDVLMAQPVLNAAMAAEALGIKVPNVYPALNSLIKAGVLMKKNEYRVGTFWWAPSILSAVDRFAERAGRRELS